MNKPSEFNLITDLALYLKLPDTEAFIETGALTVGNTVVVLKHDKAVSADTLWVRVDCGALPGSLLLIVAPVLLQLNCMAGIHGGMVYSVLPQSENTHVFLIIEQRYSFFASAEQLAQYLRNLVAAMQADWECMLSEIEDNPLGFSPNVQKHLSCLSLVCSPNQTQFGFERYHWNVLMEELVNKLGMNHQEKARFIDNGLITMSGIGMQLFFDDNRSDCFDVCIDVGPVPEKVTKHVAYLGLLGNNAVLGADYKITWGINPSTLHAIAVMRHNLSSDSTAPVLPTVIEFTELLIATAKEFSAFWQQFEQVSSAV